jgi:uncharacterized protein (TIGR02099 family)
LSNRNLLRQLTTRLFAVAATVLIVLAIGVGGFRLLVTQLPGYQAELQAWVNEALGLELEFERLDARWGMHGPQLTFHGATVGAGGQRAPFLVARQASVVLSPLALVTRRELNATRLTFEGTELAVERTEQGLVRLQGTPFGSQSRWYPALELPPEVEVVVRDSRVLYVDRQRNLSWMFDDVTLSLNRDTAGWALEARARPPGEFASRLELTAQGTFDAAARPGGAWRMSVDSTGVDLAVLARSLPPGAPFPVAGRGDVSLGLEGEARQITRATVDFSLSEVELPALAGTDSHYTRAAAVAEWQPSTTGWRVALDDVELGRDGRIWPGGTSAELELSREGNELRSVVLRSDFLRLEDLMPFVSLLPASVRAQFVSASEPAPESSAAAPSSAPAMQLSAIVEQWRALAPRGDVFGAELSLTRSRATPEAEGTWEYGAAGQLAGVGIRSAPGRPGFRELTGELRADSRSGRLELRTRDAVLAWPDVFRREVPLRELSGIVVWRQGQDAVRVVSDDLLLATPDGATRSNLELTLPLDGGSATLDLETSVGGFDAIAVKRYLPAHKMPRVVVDWLEGALQGGRVRSANVTLFGPIAAFPFDEGEGEFRATAEVEDGVLEFVRDWPRAEELSGTVEFLNASFGARGTGRVLGNRSSDVEVGIRDLRDAVLSLRGTTDGPLDDVLEFLKDAPLIARHLGPDFDRLGAPSGMGQVTLDLALPLLELAAFDLSAELDIADGELAFDGFAPRATELRGTLELEDGVLTGDGIEAIFLDGPVTARVVSPGLAGYHARLEVEGEVAVDAIAGVFRLPFADLFAGQTRWQGTLLIPAHGDQQTAPVKASIGSNLSGVALRFPTPFAKAPGEPTNLQVEVEHSAEDGTEVQGYLGASRRFALSFEESPDGRLALERGALRFGGELPEPHSDRGLTVDGSLPHLPLDDWLALARSSSAGGAGTTGISGALLAGADLAIADFSIFGQQLGSSRLTVRRRTDDWQIEVDSEPIAGTILVPVDLDDQPRVVAIMKRLYLTAAQGAGSQASALRQLDPRNLPGLQLHSDEFGVGNRRLGRLDAEVLAEPLGLRLVSFESSTSTFTAQGSGGWLVGADGATTTRMAMNLSSTDLADTLERLGFDPSIEAELADVTASVFWPGPPSGDWLQHVNGDVALRVGTGSLVDVEPGAGRMVGLLSVTALPRRLALDFRDVVNKGFVFDDISADFTLIDGNAYTDNLKLTGPSAEIGVVGRTGLRDHDYRQQAVVMAEPGKVLPTVGGLLGGPGVAAALLIFTRIFKEPLKGIGRASYCVTGTWQEPVVERLTAEQLERGELCAELPPGGFASGLADGARP